MKTKVCTGCGKRKLLKYFYNKSKYDKIPRSRCKKCCNLLSRSWEKHNCQKKRRWLKAWQEKNREKVNQYARDWRRKHKKKSIQCVRRWRRDNPLKNKQSAQKTKNKIQIKLANRLRTRLWHALRGVVKSAHTLELLGCSISQLIKHLEKQFKKGMTWANYGKWHVDHVKPLSSFDLTKPKQQQLVCNYKNLQPLWAKENFKKNSTCLI